MTPFYAMLRAVPNKLLGLMTMAAAIALMFVLPWLDRSPVRSIRYKGMLFKNCDCRFCHLFYWLGYLGHEGVSPLRTMMARIFTVRLFWLLFTDAVLYSNGKNKTFTGAGHRMMMRYILAILINIIFFLLALGRRTTIEGLQLAEAPIDRNRIWNRLSVAQNFLQPIA